MPSRYLHTFPPFSVAYSFVAMIVLGLWASDPHSHLLFVTCLGLLAWVPFALRPYSVFEPITIYLAPFVAAFTVKPLLNDFLAGNSEGFLFALSGNESLYELGFPFAGLLVLIHIYLVHIFYSWATRYKRRQFYARLSESRSQSGQPHHDDLRLWRRTALVGLLIYVPALIYFIFYVRGLDYAEYAVNRNELLRGQGLAWLFATLGTPLAITYVYLVLSESTSKWRYRLYLSLAVFCAVSSQIVAPGRGNLLNIVIASVILFWWKRGPVSVARLAALAVMFVVFSFAVLHVRELGPELSADSVVFFLVQDVGLFDYFVVYVGQMLSSNQDLSYGSQLFGNLYILLPRFIFPSKPIWFSTLEIQDAHQFIALDVSHVSISSFSEWLFNFGIIGIAMGSFFLAMTLAAFFRHLATRGTDARLLAYSLILPIFVIGHVKGGFSLAFVFLVLSPAWLVLALYLGARYLRA